MDEFVYITDSTYTREQLTQMERAFLKVLDFKMAAPTTYQFLSLFMSIQPVCATTQNLAMVSTNRWLQRRADRSFTPVLSYPLCSQYLADLSLLEADLFPLYTPSVLAAAVYSLAAYTVSNSFWVSSFATKSWLLRVTVTVFFLKKYDPAQLFLSHGSPIPCTPSRVTPWPTFCPVSPTSTSSTSMWRLTHSRPSGKIIRPQSKVSFSCFLNMY